MLQVPCQEQCTAVCDRPDHCVILAAMPKPHFMPISIQKVTDGYRHCIHLPRHAGCCVKSSTLMVATLSTSMVLSR